MKQLLTMAALAGALVAAGCSTDRGGSYDDYNTGWGTGAEVDRSDVTEGPTSTAGISDPSFGAERELHEGTLRTEEVQTEEDTLATEDVGGSTIPGGSTTGSSTGRTLDPASNTNNVNDNLTGEDLDR